MVDISIDSVVRILVSEIDEYEPDEDDEEDEDDEPFTLTITIETESGVIEIDLNAATREALEILMEEDE